ncbi:MAG: homoserine kinase [Gammaproteobacteria bacterium]|nr:homoserine kinase [Gammaproteobacteria bacterium]
MSVYTPINRPQLEAFLSLYDEGALLAFSGISAGIENSNFFVTTERGEFVLTLFEKHAAYELPFFLNLMAHLADHGIPSAHPIADRHGDFLQQLNGKPAALVRRLTGASPNIANLQQCGAVGQVLARLHLAVRDFKGHRENDRGYSWWLAVREVMHTRLTDSDARLLGAELQFQRQDRFEGLPRGIIHADLFRDNAMFMGDALTGVIDFYYACDDVFMYDLAITANDWCSGRDGSLEISKIDALLAAYDETRPLLPVERRAWPVMVRAAALRFWLSRLYDKHFPRAGHITHTKDPDEFKLILMQRIEHSSPL